MDDPRIAARRDLITYLHSQGLWDWYGSAAEAVHLLDWPTFCRGMDAWEKRMGEPADATYNANARKPLTPGPSPAEGRGGKLLYCAHPVFMPFRSALKLCKWPENRVTFHISGTLPGLTAAELLDAAIDGVDSWCRVSKLDMEYTANAKTANIRMRAVALDKRGGVLGDSEMPCGLAGRTNAGVQLDQRYDTRDVWQRGASNASGKIDPAKTIRHEVGHGIGIDHISAGNAMAAYYDADIEDLQPGDIAEAVRRYEARAVAPAPKPPADPAKEIPPAVPGPGKTQIVIDIAGEITAASITGMRVFPRR